MKENKLIWRSEGDMAKDAYDYFKKREGNESMDTYVIKAEGLFRYKGIAYLIKVLRYNSHGQFKPMDSGRISESHVVVEYPDETKWLVNIIQGLPFHFYNPYSEFLWHDSLHTQYDGMSVEEQVEAMQKTAKADIDAIFDGKIDGVLDGQIEELMKAKKTLEELKHKVQKKVK